MRHSKFDTFMVASLLVVALLSVGVGVKAMYDLQQINWSKVIAK